MKRRFARPEGQRPVLENLESRTLLTVGLLITEFMADNTKTLKDAAGNYADWIEIYNPTASAVDLNNWSLTDSASSLSKWKFPDVSLGSGAYMVVFATGTSQAVAGQELDTNFKLASSGGYLGLVEPDGLTIDSQYVNYPGQLPDISYGLTTTSSNPTLVAGGGVAATALVPTDDSVDDTWTEGSFDDSAWLHGTTGVGFDTSGNYNSMIGTNVQSSMYGVNTSVYVRIAFNVTNPASFTSLTLGMKFDDGFVATLNGDPVADANDPTVPAWNSAATASSTAGSNFTLYDLSGDLGDLQAGTNILAIQGLTASMSSTNALVLPELYGATATYLTDPSTARYFQAPSPGALNVGGSSDLGPIISNITNSPASPLAGQSIVVNATVKPAFGYAVTSVVLHYCVQFNSVVTLTMYDDGAHGDGAAGDGVFGATIPSSAYTTGQMVRWYVTSTDSASHSSRMPLYTNPTGSSQYDGTVVQDTSYAATQLPVLLYFLQTPSAADTYTGTRGDVYFLGELYDNVFVKLRGSTVNGGVFTSNLSRKIDFNDDHKFLYDPSEQRDSTTNVNLPGPQDDSYLATDMSYWMYSVAGAAGSIAFLVHTQQNGAYSGTRVMYEQCNSNLLQRVGLDPNGDLYKAEGNNLSTLPTGSNHAGGMEQKTGTSNMSTQITALWNGVSRSNSSRHTWVMDNVDLAEAVNYLAADVLMENTDCVQTNYLVYCDTDGTGEWSFLPYDRDLTWGHYVGSISAYTGHVGDMVNPDYPDYAYPYNSSIRGYNGLTDAIKTDPVARVMFYTRLRDLMDEFLKAPGTSTSQVPIYNEINTLVSSLSYESSHSELPGQDGGTFSQGISDLDTYVSDRQSYLYGTIANAPSGWNVTQPAAFAGEITIASYDADPASGDQDQEYIQLTNPNSYAVDMSGWHLSSAVDYTFPNGTVLVPGGSVYVAADPADFRARTTGPKGGQGLFVEGPYSGHLDNQGETIRLVSDANLLIDSKSYGGDSPVINEVMTNNGSGNDWIELFNPTSSTVNLAGWHLSDKSTNLTAYTIPAGTTLAAGAYITFTESQFGFGLSKYGDSVYLSNASSVIIDSQSFGGSAPDVTFGRYLTQEGHWDFTALATPTPGFGNAGPMTSSVVVDEIMYHPLDGNDEYIELQNTTTSAVSLFDTARPADTWTISGGITYSFPTSTQIPASGLLVVTGADVSTTALNNAFRSKYSIPSNVQILGPWSGKLNNAGDEVDLNEAGPYDSGDAKFPVVEVDRVNYSPTYPWASAADGTGKSLERIAPTAYGNDPFSWLSFRTGNPGYAPLLPGDANSDGKVSFADYLILEANFGKAGVARSTGDFNGDGKVSFADYLLLEANFGKSVALPGASPSNELLAPLALSTSTTDQTLAVDAPLNLLAQPSTSSAPQTQVFRGRKAARANDGWAKLLQRTNLLL